MPLLKNHGNWSVNVRRLVVIGIVGAVAYAVGRGLESRHGLSELSRLRERNLREEERSEQNRLKTLAKARGLRLSLYGLVDALQVEVPKPLATADDFVWADCPGVAPVNILAWGDEGFLFCDYSNVFYIDAKTWQTQQLPKPEIKGTWVPTGLACIKDEGTVLVANYTAHNVLEFRFAAGRLEWQHTYECPGMESPEGVAVSHDGSLVGVADYDGNRLWVFQRRGPLAWQKEVGNAHGVAFGAASVYVTGLGDRSVVQLSLDGRIIRKIGGLGWGETEFLWPTSVFVDEQGVLISDAHTGKVSLFKHDLSFVDSFGGNGPGMSLFNMPYCAIRFQGKFWICDTFKRRILRFDPATGIERQFSAVPPVAPRGPVKAVSKPRREYADLSCQMRGVPPQMPEGLIIAGYGRLSQLDEKAGEWRSLNLPEDYTSLWSPGMFTYFTWTRTIQQGGTTLLAIGASSHPAIFVIHPDGRCTLENLLGRSAIQNGLDGVYELDGSRFDLNTVAVAAMEKFSRHDSLLGGAGGARLEAARAAFWPKVSAADFPKRVAAEFLSAAGRQFWAAFSRAGQPSEEEAAARDFDKAMEQTRGEINLTELWMRNILVPRNLPAR